MGAHRLVDRQRISVGGADDTLTAFVTTVGAGSPEGIAAARTLVASTIDWPAIRAEIVDSERAIILAEQPTGPILAARFLDPAAPTMIHAHGHAGAALVVEGRQRYERFERAGDTAVRLESIHDLTVGDVAWWNDPPDDIHRQTGMGDGAIELVLLAGPPDDDGKHSQEPTHESELRAALIAGFLDGDIARLRPLYCDDVLVDVNAPNARFQLRGRDDALATIEHEEFSKPDRRLTFLRATDTTDGLLLETDTRAPVLTVSLSPAALWPPNHQLVPITATVSVEDACDPAPHVRLVSVTSSEADNGLGDGDTPGDIQGVAAGTDDRAFSLRAERSGSGRGRVYTAHFTATDASNVTTVTAVVG